MARMTMNEYQKLAMRTSPWDGHDKIDNAALGMIGETGELADVYKKWKYQSGEDAPMPVGAFAEELGDVLWYIAELADGMNLQMADISIMDFAELDRRAAKKGKHKKIRAIIVNMCGRACALRRAADARDWNGVETQVRMILAGASFLAWQIGENMERIACANIEKLKMRYPKGFDARISMKRYEG